MPSSEKYRAGYLNSLERKLFLLRDEDGTRNLELSKVVRRMQREMGSQKSFIGVVPFGSSTLGYSTRTLHGEQDAASDIDFALLYDSTYDPAAHKKLDRIYKSERARYRAESANSFPVHMPGSDRYDLSLKRIDEAIADLRQTPMEERKRVARAIALLCMLAVGPEVDNYRRSIGAKISALFADDQQVVFNTILREVLLTEHSSERGEERTKMELRMLQSESRENIGKMREKREQLWRRRISRVLGLHTNSV